MSLFTFSRFDVSNSRTACAAKSLACGYGVYLDEQSRVLSSMEHSIAEVRVKGKKDLLPFQIGILTSIAAIRGLFQDLWSEGNQFLLTGRCNSEATKECFSYIRSLGPTYDPPDQSEVVNRIRLLVMTREWAQPEPQPEIRISGIRTETSPEVSAITIKAEPLLEDAVSIAMAEADLVHSEVNGEVDADAGADADDAKHDSNLADDDEETDTDVEGDCHDDDDIDIDALLQEIPQQSEAMMDLN